MLAKPIKLIVLYKFLLVIITLVEFLTFPQSNKNEDLKVTNTDEVNVRPDNMVSLFDNNTYVHNDKETMDALLNSIELDQISKWCLHLHI